MNFDDVMRTFNEVFIEVFEDDQIKLEYETTAKDIEAWDSLNHIYLVVALEKKFGLKFTSREIQGFSNVGEMCDGVVKKLDEKGA